jgi:hypothetical protein
MCNGVSSRFRHIVSGLAAVATAALLGSTLHGSGDAERLQGQGVAHAVSTVTAEVRRDAILWRV